MKQLLFFLILQLLSSNLVAQFIDDFSSDLSAWQGDVDDFQIDNEEMLQLNALEAGLSTVFTEVTIPDSTVWEIYFRMEFAPSDDNQLRIYLQADDLDLQNADGYFLEIGETGSEDAIHFYRQDGGIPTLLASGTLSAVGSSPAEARFRMERQADATWNLLVDYSNGSNYNLEFSVSDANYVGSPGQFFGFICEYTSTRKDKFFFDDVLIDTLIPDTEPPILIAAIPVSSSTVDITFNEKLDPASAEELSNYVINNGIGVPLSADLDGSNPTLVHLTLATDLVNAPDYSVTTTNIGDELMNISGSQTAFFSFFQPDEAAPFDILINEIMADPTPTIGLPNAEYIELYNRSDKVIDLVDFGFSNGSTPKLLPSYILQPDSYVIVTDDENLDSLSVFGEVIVLSTFPALTNGGDDLTLTNAEGEIIHFVKYNLDWYRDGDKEEGGYSLELINPFNICEGEINWIGSQNILGGTPGNQNALFESTVDEKRPELLRAYVSANNPTQVKLFFSEILDESAAQDVDNYTIDNGISVTNAVLTFPSQTNVLLNLDTPLSTGTTYEVILDNAFTDCNQNPIGTNDRALFSLPETIEEGDIAINELLFDPRSGGSDFIELYNKTNKTFDLSELLLSTINIIKVTDTNTGEVRDSVDENTVAIGTQYLFTAGSYLVLTSDPKHVLDNYTVQNPQWLLNQTLPALSNTGDNISVLKGDLLDVTIIDSLTYSDEWHHALLDDREGVSLERINTDAVSTDAGNWHSAASTAGYATPTAPNSQTAPINEPTEDVFTLVNRTFSPDGDGYKDFLQINYQLEENGYVANARIFDASGREIKQLLRNEILGLEGTFKWDGSTNSDTKVRIGIYIVWIELFEPTGGRREEKLTCVVGGNF